jgi:hypothetical protein
MKKVTISQGLTAVSMPNAAEYPPSYRGLTAVSMPNAVEHPSSYRGLIAVSTHNGKRPTLQSTHSIIYKIEFPPNRRGFFS